MLSFLPVVQIPVTRRLTLRMVLLTVAGSLVAVLSASEAWAQTEDGAASSQPSPAPAPVGDDPAGQTFTAGWDHGISVESSDHAYKVQFGGLIQVDGRFAVNEPAVVDTFVLRRVRPILQGRVARVFEFRLMPDFANSTLVLFDAYIDTVFSDAFRIRVGKDKVPVGLEQLQMDYSTLFTERSLATNLVPNRDIGVQIRGDLKGRTASYMGSVVNGVPDAANGDAATNNGKDFNGRHIGRLGADVVPKHPFAPGQGTWGAVQLIARYDALTIDPLAFTLGLAATGASQQANAYAVGVDWYLNEYVKYVAAFERTVFDNNPSRPRKPENAVTFRVQLNLQPTT